MKAVLVFAALAACAVSAAAQEPGPAVRPPRNWLAVWAGGYTNGGGVYDPASRSTWDFGSSLAGGVGVHRQVGSGLVVGLETSFAPAPFERSDSTERVVDRGRARLVTALATGRLRYGGGGPVGLYLTGGAGTLVYGMPTLGRWDPDLALLTGAGLEYRPRRAQVFFVEWGRLWTFHQKEGVEDNDTRFSQLRAGVRIGW
mgnify:FL=1